ncbi:FlgB family protein [Jannaschia pohangensis]|uniref:Flagellar basal-body rod protein FlgB n=1 Tax=Jannaschia pohangensis TaxID=390807 RepID=A0A1I3R9G5_9RHOB|nr:FlgB family protein [Jannaschia pohangensis]SFJ42690.1 flagellar basal-body rod protein FlgB [Jannaschia pohangensis]
MNEIPNLLRLAAGTARHAAARQAVIATNVANADTPGFKARDMTSFPNAVEFEMRATRSGHLGVATAEARSFELRDQPADPNGNTVDLEDQILRGIEASRRHDRAITVYQNALDMMRSTLGRR